MTKMNKKVAMVIKCYDHEVPYWVAIEQLENGKVAPYAVGKMVFFKITKDGLDEIVKDAMDNGYDEVMIDEDVKKELGL